MSIHYVLYPNRLTDGPEDYAARVRPAGRADMDALIERMLQRGSTVTRADILSALEDFFGAIEDLLRSGFNVGTPLAEFRLSLRGLFDGDDDGFDPLRHQVAVSLSPGARLRALDLAGGGVSKLALSSNVPRPRTYTDVSTTGRNDQLTPNSIGKLGGYYLQFDPADPAQGIFFRAADDSETRVEVVSENGPRRLQFLVPDVAAGEYRLLVRTAPGPEGEPPCGALPVPLTVS